MSPAGANAGAASNQYQILGHLATGGMAELYLARAVGIAGFERYVVLKRIMAEHSRNHRFVTMFLDEARLAAQLHHPNIAQVYDIGRVSDSYFFTMEYVHGENVRDILQRVAALKRQIPIEQTLTVIAGAAAGLHYAHDKRGIDRQPLGIVHRDVSPSNLMVAYEGAVKLVDFGIAKASHRMTETRSGAVKGKVAYMSPEQCTGHPLDRRSDLFALGIVFYEMATMTRLFKHPTDFETMTHIVNGAVPLPTSRRPDLSRDVEAVIMRALAKRPEDRFQSAEEMLGAIETVATRERLSLSTMSLGRYLRELFGERPEPWYELEAAGEHTGLVTVETTSADVPAPVHDPFNAVQTARSWSAGGRTSRGEWVPGAGGNSGPVSVSVESLGVPEVPGAPPRAPITTGAPTAQLRAAAGSQPPPIAVVDPSLIPAPPVLPATSRAAPPPPQPGMHVMTLNSLSPPPPPAPAVPPRPPLPLVPEPEAETSSDPAHTVVGPPTGPLVLQSPDVLRATPDQEPSWGGERDPSWRGGSGVDAIDVRPRRPWVIWTAVATAAIGVVVIILASSGGGGAASSGATSGGGGAATSAPAAPPDPAPSAAPAPDPAPASAAAADPEPVAPPTPTPPPAPVAEPAPVEPEVAIEAPAEPPATDKPIADKPAADKLAADKPAVDKPGPARTKPRPKKKPPDRPVGARCGDAMGLYPPCG